ncbi:helix-turn-helix domain-containing protein [Ferrovum myxofaciens]|uniref:helix-turn-helix domain-containing protein n=1 Tax=Ferrovum myxofaciens TaxID=416213 RepID=UPI0004E210E3|nr:helix-turn-helix domain-containing protein [Ferrovum myxofaciens]
MHNSQALANRNFVIRQGDMRRLYEEGTGSVMVKAQSVPFQGVPRVWDLLSPAAPNSWKGHIATTGACLVFIKNRSSSPEAPAAREFNLEAARSPASVLDVVRTIFGMNISDTAEVFGITRQTAYQWIKFTDMEQVRSNENRVRIKQLYGVAQSWQNYPPLKGRWLHALLPTGNTVLDLLKAPQIDHDALQAGYRALAASTADRRREEGGRATQAATALTGAFAGLGAGRKSRNG